MDRYPDIDSPDFQFLIARRLEFRNLNNVDGLYPHQEFVRRFMSPYTPYRSLIMYHSLGSGKSIACIAVAVDHFLHDGKKCFIVTKGDSGTNNFAKQIRMYRQMSRSKWDPSIFSMKHYISMSNQIINMSDDDITEEFSNSILILDEVHNVRYLKKAAENTVYGSIMKLLKLCVNVKVIIATATPMTDSPEQINSLLGICNHSRMVPESYRGIISYNSVIRDKPASRQMGTTEYIPDLKVYASPMRGHQESAYESEHSASPPDDIYRKLTHISLFCFADGTHGRDVTDTKMSKTRMKTTITSISTGQTKEIKYTKYSILPEYADSLTGEELRSSSSKYSAVVDLIESSKGNVFIFLEEVRGSGLLLLASVLERHGYEMYLGERLESTSPGRRYTMCVGSSDICPNNNDRLDGFNSDLNKNGDYVRILLGSRVIGESITLKNVRQFYCLTPHWNDSTVDQAIGRVVRNGSHSVLRESERNVDIYIHAAIYPADPHNSVDIKKLARCKDKEKMIQKVSDKMIESAVDRYVNDEHVPITDVANFAAAYMHHHEEKIPKILGRHFARSETLHIGDIAKKLKMDPTICNEALCRFILSNSPVVVDGKTMFIRAYGETVYLVEDPSLPFVMVPDAKYEVVDAEPAPSLVVLQDEDFRYMPAKHKAAYLEECISQKRLDLVPDTVYAKLDGAYFHLLHYRDLESSYTSSNPVPKKPTGKTRMFDGARWTTVSGTLEQSVFDRYRMLVKNVIDEADRRFQVYGLISTIDGDMRLRLRGMEDRDLSSSDNRYVRRGKSIKSIKKQTLLEILSHITGKTVQPCTSINEMVRRIDDALVNAGLYVVL